MILVANMVRLWDRRSIALNVYKIYIHMNVFYFSMDWEFELNPEK